MNLIANNYFIVQEIYATYKMFYFIPFMKHPVFMLMREYQYKLILCLAALSLIILYIALLSTFVTRPRSDQYF